MSDKAELRKLLSDKTNVELVLSNERDGTILEWVIRFVGSDQFCLDTAPTRKRAEQIIQHHYLSFTQTLVEVFTYSLPQKFHGLSDRELLDAVAKAEEENMRSRDG